MGRLSVMTGGVLSVQGVGDECRSAWPERWVMFLVHSRLVLTTIHWPQLPDFSFFTHIMCLALKKSKKLITLMFHVLWIIQIAVKIDKSDEIAKIPLYQRAADLYGLTRHK